jgi:parallel beta-helix repeat protein
VEITAELSRITLDGQGKATIHGPDKNTPAIAVLGRDITIKGFTVRGGRQGISIVWGGTAIVDGNTVENTGRSGVALSQNSSARITNNTIRNNPNQGILVAGSSFAWIGFTDNVEETTPKPNTIQNNGVGIEVDRGSAARIHGNTITDNKGYGVGVERGSQADIGGNAINGNGGDGIFMVGNSTANLGSDTGSDFRRTPNTSGAPNSGFGIRCSINSSADGRLGTLNGSKGAKDFKETGCVDSLIP